MKEFTESAKNIQSNNEKYSIVLPITISDKASFGNIDEYATKEKYSKKSEFHITLIGYSVGHLLQKKGVSKEQWQSFLSELKQLELTFSHTDIFYEISKTYFHKKTSTTENRFSIIELLEMQNNKVFSNLFEKHFGITNSFFPHVTHFVRSDNQEQKQGIGVGSADEFYTYNPQRIIANKKVVFTKIHLPTRPQIDTIIALVILRKFGESVVPGVSSADIYFNKQSASNISIANAEQEGILLLDMGGGRFDHHEHGTQKTLTEVVVEQLGIEKKLSIKKLVTFARRDDVDGQGTVSKDGIDRAFGLSGLLVALNRKYVETPEKPFQIIAPLLEIHLEEQIKRTEELPALAKKMEQEHTLEFFSAKHRGKNIKGVYFECDEPGMASYFRSQMGGNYDVIIQKKTSGHINILTHTNRRPDLRAVAVVIRRSEMIVQGKEEDILDEELSVVGRIDVVPEWFLDLGTNSFQNGGVNPQDIEPTKIPKEKIISLVKIGLEESMWAPKK